MKKILAIAAWVVMWAVVATAEAADFIDERVTSKPAAAASGDAAETKAPVIAAVPAPPPKFIYELRTGEPIHSELKRWAEHSGWQFYWYHSASWRTLRVTVIDKPNAEEAISEVVDILRLEGKPVQLRISDGNRVMEVLSTEVRND
jgi:hypothetical protein